MAKLDISALSIDELKQLVVDAETLTIKRRGEELKKLVDDLIEESKAINVTIADVVKEIKRRETGSVVRKPKASGTSKKEPKPWEPRVAYCNPKDEDEQWVGGTKGPKPPWLVALVPKAMSFDKQKAEYLKLVKKQSA